MDDAQGDEARLVQMVFDAWRDGGDWPKVDSLQRRLARADVDIDVRQVGMHLDPAGGRIDWPNQTIRLYIQGVAACTGSDEYTTAFVQLVQLMARKYLDEPHENESPSVTSEECRDILHIPEPIAIRLRGLVESENSVWQGITPRPDGQWTCTVAAGIRHYAKIQTFDDYVAVKAKLLQPPSPGRTGQRGELGVPFASRLEETGEGRLSHRESPTTDLTGRVQGSGIERPLSVFLSHVAAEGALASAIKVKIETAFGGRVQVFSASDPAGLRAGERWLESISQHLAECDVQLILLGPSAPTRPWINFEAGAVWSTKRPQIPICHSGLQPGKLPVPLSLLQGGVLDDAAFWRSTFGTIAGHAAVEIPEVDWDALAIELSKVAREVAAAQPISVPAPHLESPNVAIPADEGAGLRAEMLRELRDLRRQQARTSTILPLDLVDFAHRHRIGQADAQDVLSDLLGEGFAEPYAATLTQSAEQGACRITEPGMRELRRLETRG